MQNLSTGVTFGFGSATAAAPNPQATIALAPVCGTLAATKGVSQGTIANTSCIEFNSRGIPICSVSACGTIGTPTANDAFYVTDGNSVYGVTIIASGLMQDWSTSAANTNWQSR